MWHKITGLYRVIGDEQCMVLADPATLDTVPPGYRRFMARKFATMGAPERARLLAFSLKYRGKLLWTRLAQITLVSSLCALAMHLLFPQLGLVKLLIQANALGFSAVVLVITFYLQPNFMKPLHFVLFYVIAVGGGMIMGTADGGWERGFTFVQSMQAHWVKIAIACGVTGLIVAVPVAITSVLRNRKYKLENAKLELDAERHRSARELSESRLRMLHAQIEPHFLFNTLGAVQQLAEKNAPDAARLTASLIAFLRASLAEMRHETVTLAADFDLIEAYLQVMETRLGTRLDYALDLPQALSQIKIPSMLLLTLVENAIKHGIEPSLRGGRISVTAVAMQERLHLNVSDSGAGLGSAPGSGHGLDNVRSRLKLLYGEAAGLSITDGEDGGVVASIVLPLNKETA